MVLCITSAEFLMAHKKNYPENTLNVMPITYNDDLIS
jgi:hypothetical protein